METQSNTSIPLQVIRSGNPDGNDTIDAKPAAERQPFEVEPVDVAAHINVELEKKRSNFRTFIILVALYVSSDLMWTGCLTD
jgi:hypothetical protein